MSLADYAHWNEEAERVWWEEEGRHADTDADYWRDEQYDAELEAAQAYSDDLAELEDEQLLDLLRDTEYFLNWPKARPLVEWEVNRRGLAL